MVNLSCSEEIGREFPTLKYLRLPKVTKMYFKAILPILYRENLLVEIINSLHKATQMFNKS